MEREIYGFRFKKWKVYNDALAFRKELSQTLKSFPKAETYALIDQIRRAANSIILNIAECASKASEKEKRVYINRAQCSLDEIVASLDCSLTDNFITVEQYKNFLLQGKEIARQLNAFNLYILQILKNSTS